jgi:predicted GNAT family acetyltransferase
VDVRIQHTHYGRGGVFFIESEGVHLAELTYVRADEGLVVIDHTHVHPGLRHQGVARRLVDAAVEWARLTKTRFAVTCSYVKTQFEHDASIRDVLA